MKVKTFLLIIGITVRCFALMLVSSRLSNAEIETKKNKRSERNLLAEMIEATEEDHPQINSVI